MTYRVAGTDFGTIEEKMNASAAEGWETFAVVFDPSAPIARSWKMFQRRDDRALELAEAATHRREA